MLLLLTQCRSTWTPASGGGVSASSQHGRGDFNLMTMAIWPSSSQNKSNTDTDTEHGG